MFFARPAGQCGFGPLDIVIGFAPHSMRSDALGCATRYARTSSSGLSLSGARTVGPIVPGPLIPCTANLIGEDGLSSPSFASGSAMGADAVAAGEGGTDAVAIAGLVASLPDLHPLVMTNNPSKSARRTITSARGYAI